MQSDINAKLGKLGVEGYGRWCGMELGEGLQEWEPRSPRSKAISRPMSNQGHQSEGHTKVKSMTRSRTLTLVHHPNPMPHH